MDDENKAEQPIDEHVNEEIEFVDYHTDVNNWIKDNNGELAELEDAIGGLLKAFKHPVDFADGVVKLDAKMDMGKYFLEFVTRYVSEFEESDTEYRGKLKAYIEGNTKNLKSAQESTEALLKVYEFPDDFLGAMKLLKNSVGRKDNDLAITFLETIEQFVESGLVPIPEEKEQ